MINFVIDESILRRLSPTARRELLQLLRKDVAQIKSELADIEWNPEGNLSYPLNEDEALALVRGLSEASRRMLRVFARNFDGEAGYGELNTLMQATDHEHYDQLGYEVAAITQALRSITGDIDAWLVNWRPDDWQWDEERSTYSKGMYYISGPAIHSLRRAFGIEPRGEPSPESSEA